ncbi:MAG: prolyl oligopeptidase family serine peptidase [bacterium]
MGRKILVLALPFLLLFACGDDDGGATDAAVDARVDAGLDGGDATAVETVPLEVGQWLAAMADNNDDQVFDALEQGAFALPTEGSYLGVNWTQVTEGDNHSIANANLGLFYAAAEIDVPAGHRVFARADSVYYLFTNNRSRQSGDIYHSRSTRIPVGTDEGTNLVVALNYARSNAAEIELWSTNAELVFNDRDVTAPDFIEGLSDEQWLGIATLHLGRSSALHVSAQVVEDATFEASSVLYDSLAPDTVTQLSFLLRPKAPFTQGGQRWPATLRIESPSFERAYEAQVEVGTVAAGSRYRQTRRSQVDGSTQYHAVMPPTDVQPGQTYGLILSLHGAGVEASGQAASYSPKDWAYLVAPTNRRRFGFDWEEWGRLDALEALGHASATLPIDPERTHLTGHSMGGHGTWNVGVHNAGRFGVIAPSAGWISFELYAGPDHPDGLIGRARGHSQTLDFVDNFRDNQIYIIHGDADDNVPVSHARQMFQTLGPIVTDLDYHEEPGAGHWWDLDPNEEGADCVDWEPMIEIMRLRTRELTPLSFHFSSSAPWVSSQHSFVTVLSATSPLENFTVDATATTATMVELSTTNVRSMVLDGAALADEGVTSVVVDDATHTVTATTLEIGPQDGKIPSQYGPLNQLWHRPFCFVYDEAGPAAYRWYAAYLLSDWSLTGNGHGCAVALGDLTPAIEDGYNLIYLGVDLNDIPGSGALPLTWDSDGITVNNTLYPDSAVAFIYPDGDKVAGYFYAAAGAEYLLFRYSPWSSRSGMPDFFVWAESGLVGTGFFDGDWQLEPLYTDGF